MQTRFLVLGLMVLAGNSWSQSESKPPLSVNIVIRHEITGKPIDADLEWPEKTKVRRASPGSYFVSLQGGQNEVLTISRNGYFDTNLKLNYDEEETTAYHEVRLKPGIPQLLITIVNSETDEQLTSAIDLFTMNESSVVFSDSVETAPYTIDLEYNQVHVLQVRRPGFFSFKDTIDYKGVFDGRTRERKIGLVPLKEGNKISLNNIYFKPNETLLTDFGKLMLIELTHVLQREKTLVIEVAAHTDDVGTNEYNQSLSEKRALSVKKHLVEKGAKDSQLQTKGYGETTPLVANSSEVNRAQNRRVEFKIVRAN